MGSLVKNISLKCRYVWKTNNGYTVIFCVLQDLITIQEYNRLQFRLHNAQGNDVWEYRREPLEDWNNRIVIAQEHSSQEEDKLKTSLLQPSTEQKSKEKPSFFQSFSFFKSAKTDETVTTSDTSDNKTEQSSKEEATVETKVTAANKDLQYLKAAASGLSDKKDQQSSCVIS